MVRRWLSTSSRSVTSWAILVLTVLLLVLAFVSGGTYLYVRLNSASRSEGPAHQVHLDRIDPSLALLTLSGLSDLEVVNRALANEALGTAYATALFSTELADGQRVGSLLLVAQAYGAAGDKAKARLCYEEADLVLTLSPSIADLAKAKSYLEIGDGLAGLGSRAEALRRYDQAYLVALGSPYVKEPHRAETLGELAISYQALGEKVKAGDCLARQAEIGYASGEGRAQERPPEQPVFPLVVAGSEPTAAMMASYGQRRAEAVWQLIYALEGPSPGEPAPDELLADVGRALLNEDGVRQTTYAQQLSGASSFVLKVGTARARVDWLVVKYRAALGGYGLDLVPAWTEGLTGVEGELYAAYQELRDGYDEQFSTFDDDNGVDRAWSHFLRFVIQRGELGLYPDYPQEELLTQLQEVTERLVASGDPSLRVTVFYEGAVPAFRLAVPE